jgi:hypothetical protein
MMTRTTLCRDCLLGLIFCLLAVAVGWEGAAQGAEFSSPTYGGSGGQSYNLGCGSQAVLIGVQGKAGDWVDSIMAICRHVNANGTLGDTFTKGPTGGNGGSVRSETCPTGTVVESIFANTKFDFVSAVALGCDAWNAAQRRLAQTSKLEGVSFVRPQGVQLSIIVADLGNHRVKCPDGKPGNALRGKSGTYVDSIRLICDDVVVSAGSGSAPSSTSPLAPSQQKGF